MAPTSATKKKSLAATKRKVANKKKVKTASSKATLVVSRKRKKPAATIPIPVLPSDWPVASQPPVFPSEASALRPGSLLQQTCSGNDIQLARAACVVPNFDKQKGKFLLIFPGNLSFGGSNETSKPPEVKQEESTKPSATAAAAAATMGRIEGLRTNTPTFRVPFPHLRKSLVFYGKKIATTSKFLALSCSNKKSGTVQCKNIFSSAVVFGMPKWESSSDNGTVVSTPIGTAAAAASAIVSPPSIKVETSKDAKSAIDDETNETASTIHRSFLHYGGAERTVDGATRSSRKSSSQKAISDAENTTTSTSEERVPIFSSHANDNNSSNNKPASTFDFSNNPSKLPAPTKPAATPKTPKSYDTSSSEDEDDDLHLSSDDSDDEFDAKLGKHDSLTSSATKSRLPPRRQASVTKKKYVEDDEEDEKEESSDDKSDKSNAKKTKKQAPAAAATKKRKTPSKTTKAETPAKASKAKKQTPPKKASKATTGSSSSTKKKSAPKKTTKAIESDDDDDSYASETLDQAKTPSSNSKRSAPRRKSSSQKKNVYKEVDDESEYEDSEKENASSDVDDVTPPKAKPAATKKATPRSKSTQKKTPSKSKATKSSTTPKASGTKRPRSTSASAKQSVSVLESTTPSPAKSPSFRRRHKKKSPVKKSRTVLDLTQDDEFTFG